MENVDRATWRPADLTYGEFDDVELALTVLAPWPWAMFNGDEATREDKGEAGWPCKDGENRRWTPPTAMLKRIRRGDVVRIGVHQGVGMGEVNGVFELYDGDEQIDDVENAMLQATRCGNATSLNRCMVGAVRLVAVLGPQIRYTIVDEETGFKVAAPVDGPDWLVCAPGYERHAQTAMLSPWWDQSQFFWVFAERRRCNPIPIVGKQKLWLLPTSTRHYMSEQV